jgi:DNA adenine methylase
MGSKARLLPHILSEAQQSSCTTFVDAFSGSGCVSHYMKSAGYRVVSNDVLNFAHHWTKASVENSGTQLAPDEIESLLELNPYASDFIRTKFRGLYFTDHENYLLDSFSRNVEQLDDPRKKSLAIAAMTRACLKRRPRGVFTYIGNRYDDGRRDLRMSLEDQFRESAAAWNASVFSNGKRNRSNRGSALALKVAGPALWYLDPPYFSTKSDNDYTRRYHFIEGLVSYWKDMDIQENTVTKKFRSPYREFQSRSSTYESFQALFARRDGDDLLISYSSNSLPTRDELCRMLQARGREVSVKQIEHTYTFGTHARLPENENNRVMEYLFFSPALES